MISGYLQRPIYFLCSSRWAPFVIWDQQRKCLGSSEALQLVRKLARRYARCPVGPKREVKTAEPDLIKLRQFTRSIVPTETYYLYLLKGP